MARTLVKYVFAALLALFSTQAVVPSLRVAPAIEVVYSAKAEQRTPREAQRSREDVELQVVQPAPRYISRITAEPDSSALFQRPPPASSLCL